MKFPEPKSLRGTMSPGIRACQLFGIGIFEYPIGHPRPLLSFCWSVTHITSYLLSVSLAVVPDVYSMEGSVVASHNYHLSNCCCTIFMITSMIVIRKIISNYNHQMNLINGKLNRFGIAEDYGITYKYNIAQLAVCLIQMIIISGITYYFVGSDSFWQLPNIAFWISTNYQLMSTFIIGCIYCSYVRYIGNRFQHLNAYLLQWNSDGRNTKVFPQGLDHQESTLLSMTREIHGNPRLTDRRWTVHVLREARSIHHGLCVIAKEMNQLFGIPIIFMVAISFCAITSLLFSIYQISIVSNSVHANPQSMSFLPVCSSWLVAYLIVIYYIVYCCSMAFRAGRQTGEVIHQRVKPDISKDIQAEVDAFALQLMHHPLQFTAYGFFAIDFTLIRAMAGAATTYLVVMIQLRTIYDPEPDLTSVQTTLVANSTN